MDLETLLSFEWGIMMPEFIILGIATILTLCDLFMPKDDRSAYSRLDWVWRDFSRTCFTDGLAGP